MMNEFTPSGEYPNLLLLGILVVTLLSLNLMSKLISQ